MMMLKQYLIFISPKEKTMRIDILDENDIEYIYKYNKANKIKIKYDQKAILNISIPIGCKPSSVIRFIEDNINWIIEKNNLAKEKLISYDNLSSQYVFGKEAQLIINISRTKRIDYINDKIIISVNKIEDVRNDLINWRIKLAEFVFQELLYKCFNVMKDKLSVFPSLIIKKSKTKLGCCYFYENRIMLNVSLTQVPFYLIEYVIFHELVHFLYHDHSKKFHEELKNYVNNEKECVKQLKKYSTIL